MTLFDFLFLKNDVNVPSKSNKQNFFFQKLVFCWHLEGQWRKKQDPDPGSESGSESRSIIRRHESPDPDPLVRDMDPRILIHTKMSWIPQHWLCQLSIPSFEWFERLTASANVAIVKEFKYERNKISCPFFLAYCQGNLCSKDLPDHAQTLKSPTN